MSWCKIPHTPVLKGGSSELTGVVFGRLLPKKNTFVYLFMLDLAK